MAEDARPPRAARVDHGTLEMLVTEHQAELYRYVKYLGADHALAEDLVQETFLATLKGAWPPSLSDVPRRGAWLRGIARHLLLRHWEREVRSPVRLDSRALERAEQVWTGTFPGGEDGTLHVEALRVCVEQMPERSREMLDFRYSQRKSRSEMAAAFSMSEHGVKSALQRIRARLWECVQARLKLEGA